MSVKLQLQQGDLPWAKDTRKSVLGLIYRVLLQHHQPTKSLRSSSSHQLFILRHDLSFGSRAFASQPHDLWICIAHDDREHGASNVLPLPVRLR